MDMVWRDTHTGKLWWVEPTTTDKRQGYTWDNLAWGQNYHYLHGLYRSHSSSFIEKTAQTTCEHIAVQHGTGSVAFRLPTVQEAQDLLSAGFGQIVHPITESLFPARNGVSFPIAATRVSSGGLTAATLDPNTGHEITGSVETPYRWLLCVSN
jgi:hypothetical protein